MSRPLSHKGKLHPLVDRLRAEAEGVKRLALAGESGYSQSWVNAVLAGTRRPSIDGLCKLAGALGYDVVLVKKESGAA